MNMPILEHMPKRMVIFMKIINRYKALSLPVKAALWFIVSNFLIKGISFLTVPLFTYYLSAEEYGKVGIYLTYQDMLINFATMELYSGAYIRGLLRYKDNVSFFTWSEQFLSSIITILVFILSLPAMRFLISNAQINLGIYLLMYSYFMFFPAYQCWVGRKRFEYQYKPVILLAVIYTIISVIIPLFAVIKIEATASARLTFMLIPEVMFCLPFYLKNIHLKRLFARKNEVYEQCKFLISFQAPAVIHAFSYILLSSVDRIMIGKMVGNAETGIYTVATTIASAITILCISANQVLKPWRYQSMEKNEHSTIKSTSNLLLFAFGLGISLWILIAPDLMHILFSAEYHEAIWVIPPVSMSVFFVFLYSMFVDIEEYFYKTKYTMYATTISAVANVILNRLRSGRWGGSIRDVLYAPNQFSCVNGARFKNALDIALSRVAWNYKTAIPVYYVTDHKLSLLLPLALEKKGVIDVALVCEHKLDEASGVNNYVGRTIFTLQMAYNNARLITRPDSDWLMADMYTTK